MKRGHIPYPSQSLNCPPPIFMSDWGLLPAAFCLFLNLTLVCVSAHIYSQICHHSEGLLDLKGAQVR